MSNKNLFIFIFLLALIATLLAIWTFVLKPTQKTPSPALPSPPPSFFFPSPLLSPFPPSYPSFPSLPKETKENIIDSLPYETDGYSIQYLTKTDKFFILIKQNPYQQYKDQALAWFKNFGLENPEEELSLFFTSSRWVAPE